MNGNNGKKDEENTFGVCSMHDHEEMMKADPEGFKKHLEETHGGNDPHQHDMPGIV